jgi:hypothetical protein
LLLPKHRRAIELGWHVEHGYESKHGWHEQFRDELRDWAGLPARLHCALRRRSVRLLLRKRGWPVELWWHIEHLGRCGWPMRQRV